MSGLLVRVLLTSLAVMLPITDVAASQWMDDFDVYELGTWPLGWIRKYDGCGAEYQLVVDTESVSVPNSLKLEGCDYASAAFRTLPQFDGQVTLEADLLPVEESPLTEGDSVGGIGLALFGYGIPQARVAAIFGPSYAGNRVFTWDGPWSHWDSPLFYTPNAWNHVKIIADFDAREFGLWVNDAVLSEHIPMIGDWWYEGVECFASSSGHVRMQFDNITVTWSETPVPVAQSSWGAIKSLYAPGPSN